MTRIFRHLLPGLVLAVLPCARAGLDTAIVPADARWVVYVDFNALRDSALGAQLVEIASEFKHDAGPGEIQLNIAKILDTAGLATAFGTNFSKDPESLDGTLVLQGKPELRTIAEGLVAQFTVTHPENVTELKDLPFEAYEFKGGPAIAFPPEPVVVISKAKGSLAKARDAYRGASASLEKSSSPLKALLPALDKSYLVAASVVPPSEGLPPGDGPHTRILRMADAGCLALGEAGEMTAARLQLVASSETMADKLTKIVQGVAAMLSLAQTDDQQLNAFLQSVDVVRENNQVKVSLSYPTARLAEMIKGLHEEHTAHGEGAEVSGAPKRDDAAFPPADAGEVVARWRADQQLSGDAPTPENLVVQTFPDIDLVRGAVVTVSGRLQDGERARIDYVELSPTDGGESLRYEAEYMRLKNYRVESVPFASGGELVNITGDRGSASFQFQGASGRCQVTVGYVDETDGKSTFAISIRNPETTEGPEKTTP